MKYEHIIFDIDGTLIDTQFAVIESLKKTLKEYCNLDNFEDNDLKFVLGITGRDALAKLPVKNIDEVLEVWTENMKGFFYKTKPFNAVEKCIKLLKEQGIKIGIVTSKTREEYISDFEVFGFAGEFDIAICADDTSEHKPNPEPLLKYLELASAEKEKAIYIGDSIYDMKCAKVAGIDNALALWGCACEELPKAKYYLEKPEDILQLI